MKKLSLSVFIVGFTMLACNTPKKTASSTTEITEAYWKLIELMGKPVGITPAGAREMHMILKIDSSRVQAFAGCNNITGVYELKEPNRITFSKMITTQMACANMEMESQLLKVFETADSYYITGDTLQLIRARMAPLAIFKVRPK